VLVASKSGDLLDVRLQVSVVAVCAVAVYVEQLLVILLLGTSLARLPIRLGVVRLSIDGLSKFVLKTSSCSCQNRVVTHL
jgi:hypothetical protein